MDEIIRFIREFLSDGIGRIIPGLAVITLYWSNRVSDAFDTYENSSTIVCICIVLIAWCIGLVLENLTYVPFKAMLEIYKCCKNWFCLSPRANPPSNPEPPALKPSHELHRFYMKHAAEKVLFRIMIFISLLTVRYPPTLPANIEWKNWYGWAGFVGAAVFWGFGKWGAWQNERTGAYGF